MIHRRMDLFQWFLIWKCIKEIKLFTIKIFISISLFKYTENYHTADESSFQGLSILRISFGAKNRK